MITLNHLGHRTRAAAPLILLLLWSAGAASPSFAEEGSATVPDLATLEAQYERSFAAALEAPAESEPALALRTWGSALRAAALLEGARAAAEGRRPAPGDEEAATEWVLERWRELRPEAGGPDLFRAFRIEDPAERRAAVVGLLDRYPDDPLVRWQAVHELRWDWSTAWADLDFLEPAARVRLLIAVAEGLRCEERVELLSTVAEALGSSDSSHASIASALRECSGQPAAEGDGPATDG